MEAIVCDKDVLIVGEYGRLRKRIAVISHHSCAINEFYVKDSSVTHIHSIYKAPNSESFLVTVGDTAKYLDLWHRRNDSITFSKRLKASMAGYTAIMNMGDEYFLGTDFSGRPNYIEVFSVFSKYRRKIFFPKQAYRMYVLRFMQYKRGYIACLSKELNCLGGQYALSILDAEKKEFVFCEYLQYRQPETANE